jgi:Kef-type K+ transport system membrane component KefB
MATSVHDERPKRVFNRRYGGTERHEMQGTKPLLESARSLEGILLLALFWIAVGWVLVNRTPIPNQAFVVGSTVVVIVVVWLSFRTLPEVEE